MSVLSSNAFSSQAQVLFVQIFFLGDVNFLVSYLFIAPCDVSRCGVMGGAGGCRVCENL